MQSIGLNILTPEVELLLKGYDARQAPCEVHVARFDPETGALLDISRVFKGWVDSMPVKEGGKGQPSSMDANLASNARQLTRKVPSRVSDAAHQRAQPGDRIFRYNAVSGAVEVFWGQKRMGRAGDGGRSGKWIFG